MPHIMPQLLIAESGSPLYEEALAFALEQYHDRHNCTVVVRPNILVIAYMDNRIYGTMGLMYAHAERYFFEQCEPQDAVEKLLCGKSRSTLAEITRFTIRRGTSARTAFTIGTALIARLCTYAYTHGIRHIGFVGKRSFCSILQRLSIEYEILGTPNFKDALRELLGSYPEQHNLYSVGFSFEYEPFV